MRGPERVLSAVKWSRAAHIVLYVLSEVNCRKKKSTPTPTPSCDDIDKPFLASRNKLLRCSMASM